MKSKNLLSVFGALITVIAILGVSPVWAESSKAKEGSESTELDVPSVPTHRPVEHKMLEMMQVLQKSNHPLASNPQ